MSRMRFKLNKEGVSELLSSPEMQAILHSEANLVAWRAGDGYDFEVRVGKKRAYANVYADTYEARQDNLEYNTLLKSLY